MDAQQQLLARVDALVAQLDQAEKAIKSVGPDNSKSVGPNNKLYERAGQEFLRNISDARQKLISQRRRIEKGSFAATTWATLHTEEKNCSTLFGECLAFLQAAHARGRDVEADLCEIADALLDELSKDIPNLKWDRFTVLSTDECYRDMTQIIRLRFPFYGIWDLPIATHEFGHFIAGRLNVARPDGTHYLAFQDYKEGFKQQYAERGEEWMFYLEEYFADVFATFVMGPAYALTCVLLRFDPACANCEEDRKHPSYNKRVHAILQTLSRMNSEKDTKGQFKDAVCGLTNFWNQALASAKQSAAIPAEERQQVDSLVFSFYEMLKRGAPNARFNCWTSAKLKQPWLSEPVQPPAVNAADFKISELLNSAWLCRLQPGTESGKVSNNMIQLCHLHIDRS